MVPCETRKIKRNQKNIMNNFCLDKRQVSWKILTTKVHSGGIDNLSRPITLKHLKSKYKNHLTKKTAGPECYTGKIYQPFKEEVLPVLQKLIQKIKKGGRISYVVLKGQHYPDTKITKYIYIYESKTIEKIS